MDVVIPYHNIKTSDGLSLCVRLRVVPGNHAIDVIARPSFDADQEDHCDTPVPDTRAVLPAPFEPSPSEHRISSLVTAFLKADGQAFRDLVNGVTVTTRVFANPPMSPATVNESSTLEAYRSARLAGSYLIRPILLEHPALDR